MEACIAFLTMDHLHITSQVEEIECVSARLNISNTYFRSQKSISVCKTYRKMRWKHSKQKGR